MRRVAKGASSRRGGSGLISRKIVGTARNAGPRNIVGSRRRQGQKKWQEAGGEYGPRLGRYFGAGCHSISSHFFYPFGQEIVRRVRVPTGWNACPTLGL